MSFQHDSPSLRSNSKDATRPVVASDGTGVVQIVGRFLFEANSTVVTRVTIGGTSAGLAIDPASVTMGYLNPTGGRRLGSSEPDQFLNITIPPWQGERVPLVIFKVYLSGTTAGSDPYYIDMAPPVATSAAGSNGVVVTPFQAVRARANGTSRIRISGTNVGVVGTRIVLLNTATSFVSGEFTDCLRGSGFVECTAPPGVGELDDNVPRDHLRIALVQPGVVCDPVQQSDVATRTWDTCTPIPDESQLDITPMQGWLFAYEAPVVVSVTGSLPCTGGFVTVSGYNLGSNGSAVVAWLQPRNRLQSRMDLVVLDATIPTDPDTGLQLLRLGVGPGLGVNWTVMLSVNDQLVNTSSVEQQQALLLSFDPPELHDMSVTSGPTPGGFNITLTGLNFGTPEFFGAVGRCVAPGERGGGLALFPCAHSRECVPG
jgi:hypothetical protein